ncbi:MAG: DUF4915 domain-containing protein [Chloroflexota bacterium]
MSSDTATASSILISFCNPSMSDDEAHTGGLAKFNIEDRTLERVKISFDVAMDAELSSLGLTRNATYIFNAYSDPATHGQTYVATLDAHTLELLHVTRTPPVQAVHSLVATDTDLYIVSTWTDTIAHYRINADGSLEHVGLFWQASDTGKDTHHVNAIAIDPHGDVLCSAFGPKVEDQWTTARTGYVYNISQQRKVSTMDLKHPHSLVFHNGDTYLCESGTSTLIRNYERFWQIEGFIRGLCFPRRNLAIIGTNKLRARSKSTGKPNELPKEERPMNSCGLIYLNMDSMAYEFHTLNAYNNEIYDLMVL